MIANQNKHRARILSASAFAALSHFLGFSPFLHASTDLTPGTTYTAGAGTFHSSDFLFDAGTLTLSGPGNGTNQVSDLIVNSNPLTGSGSILLAPTGTGGSIITFDPSLALSYVTLSPSISITTSNTFSSVIGSPNQSFILQGPVSCPAGSLTITGQNWTASSLSVSNNGTLNLNGSYYNIGNLTRSDQGVVNLTGTLSLGNTSLSLNASTGTWNFRGLTVNGGTINTSDNSVVNVNAGSNTFAGVTLAGTMNISNASVDTVATSLMLNNGSINLNGAATIQGSLQGTGQVIFQSNSLISSPYNAGFIRPNVNTYTYAPTITFSTAGGSGTIGGTTGQALTVQGNILSQTPGGAILLDSTSFTNAGTITASNGGIIGIHAPGFVNQGTVDLNNGGILELIGNSTTTAYRSLGLPPSALYIAGSLDNRNDSLSSTAAIPITILDDANVNGGTLTGSPDAPLTLDHCALSNLTLAGKISAIESFTTSAVTYASGSSISLVSTNDIENIITLPFNTSSTVAGPLDVAFDGSGSFTDSVTITGTLPAGVTLHTGIQSGTIGVSTAPYTLAGTISAQTPGKHLSVVGSTIKNTGTIQSSNNSYLHLTGTFTNAGLISTNYSVKFSGSFTNTGKLDLLGGGVILDYSSTSPIDTARSQLFTGRNAGDWNSPTGFTSSTAASNPNLAVGYIEASQFLGLTASQTSTWSGQSVDATSLLLQLTYYGDANFDGVVDPADYQTLNTNYQNHLTNAHWSDGDFNYDGIIDQNDYFLIDRTYGRQNSGLSPDLLSTRESQFGPDYVNQLTAAIPEPSLLSLLLAIPLLPRHRRRLPNQIIRKDFY